MHPEFYRPVRRQARTCTRVASRIAACLLCGCLIALLTMGSSIAGAITPGGPGERVHTRAHARAAATPNGLAMTSPAIAPAEAQGLDLLLTALPLRYASADPTHEPTLAAVSRVLAHGIQSRVLESQALLCARDPARTARVLGALHQLTTLLEETTVRYQPWPLSLQIDALSEQAQHELD